MMLAGVLVWNSTGKTRQEHPRICVLGLFHLSLRCDASYWSVRPRKVVLFAKDCALHERRKWLVLRNLV